MFKVQALVRLEHCQWQTQTRPKVRLKQNLFVQHLIYESLSIILPIYVLFKLQLVFLLYFLFNYSICHANAFYASVDKFIGGFFFGFQTKLELELEQQSLFA